MLFKSGQERPKGGLGRVLGSSWGALGGVRGGPGVHFGGILGAKIDAQSESAILSDK